jgi:ankyrin repeat protein
VDKNWSNAEKVFKRVTANAGIFENKQTEEFIFETADKTWHQNEIAEDLKNYLQFDNYKSSIVLPNCIKEKNWNKMFSELIRLPSDWWRESQEFLKGLAEIVDVHGGYDKFQNTNIHLGTIYGDADLLKILLKRSDANPNLIDICGKTALHSAAQNNNIGAIQILLKFGAKIDATDFAFKTALMWALRFRSHESVKSLLTHNPDLNLRDVDGRGALHYASKYSQANIIKIFLKRGAKIEKTDNELQTPLLVAVISGNVSVAEVLLCHKANPNHIDKYGNSCLHYAVRYKELGLVQTLLKHSARIDNNLKTQLWEIGITSGYRFV